MSYNKKNTHINKNWIGRCTGFCDTGLNPHSQKSLRETLVKPNRFSKSRNVNELMTLQTIKPKVKTELPEIQMEKSPKK